MDMIGSFNLGTAFLKPIKYVRYKMYKQNDEQYLSFFWVWYSKTVPLLKWFIMFTGGGQPIEPRDTF